MRVLKAFVVPLIALGFAILVGLLSAQSPLAITGTVQDEAGPVAGATVRVQTQSYATQTNAEGRFVLDVPVEGEYALTACATGYYCGGPVLAEAGDTGVVLQIEAHSAQDNPAYVWLPSRYYPGMGEDQGCAACHSAVGTDLSFTLPVDEWEQDAHSQTMTNSRFLTMYLGTDVDGNASPPTRYVDVIDYGKRPLQPDLSQPYYGPGYKLDFPDSAGNCATCHAPAAAINTPYSTDLIEFDGIAPEGIPCDFCHKIWDVKLDSVTDLPAANMPGVLSYEFRRPPDGHQFFAGPFDDVAPGEDTYLPLQTESAFCAGCHFGVFWDTIIYNSYGEWLASPYSDPDTEQTCQDCHMPTLGVSFFANPENGGLQRDPATIVSHRMPGAADDQLLQNTVDLSVSTRNDEDQLTVTIQLTNSGAGHHVPTDSPLRQMLLVVEAKDTQGEILPLSKGPVLPAWTGDLAGQPGVYFALILEEVWTGITPTSAYWNPTRVVEDTRLPALESHLSTFSFELPDQTAATVEVRVLLRRAYYSLMQQKGWNTPDRFMASEVVTVP